MHIVKSAIANHASCILAAASPSYPCLWVTKVARKMKLLKLVKTVMREVIKETEERRQNTDVTFSAVSVFTLTLH